MLSYANRDASKFHEPDMPYLTTSQKQYELDGLVKVYQDLKPEYVLEIGTQDGGTLYQWVKHAQVGAKIVNVDILQGQPETLPDVWQAWREDIELVTIVEYSHRALEQVKNELPYIDFLFIDGDHSYEGAKLDFLMYGPMVRDGGVIAFHDLMTPTSGKQDHIQVGRLWREIQHAGYVTQELWAEESPSWGGIGIVYVQAQAQIQTDGSEYAGLIQAFRPLWKSRHLPDMWGEEVEERAGAEA